MTRKLYILLTFLAFTSCYDDFDGTIEIVEKEISTTTMETGITGKITGINEESIADYELTKDGQTLISGQSKFYNYLNEATKKGQLLELFKNDRLVGITNPLLIENDINYLEVSTFPNIKSFVYDHLNGNITSVTDNIQLKLGANAFFDDKNNTVERSISIDYTVSDETEIINQLGNLAFADHEEVMLLNSTLLFINGNSRTEKLKNVPAQSELIFGSIYNGKSLFHLNEFGQFTLLEGDIDANVGIPVSSLGVFLISDYKKGVYTEGSVVKETNKVSYMPFLVKEKNYFSTAKGKWASFFPVNEEVTIDVLTPCYDVLETETLSIDDTERQFDILLDDSDDFIYNIKTKVINCDGDVEDIQAINVSSDDNSFVYVFNDSEIDTWIPICKNDFEISGMNRNLQDNGPEFSWSTDILDDLTIVSNCESYANGFGYVIINDEEHVYDSFDVEPGKESTSLKSSTDKLRLHFDGLTERMYNEQEVRIFINDPEFGENGYAISCENSALGCGIENFVVTHFEDTNNGWFRVSFSGVLWAQTIDPPVAGNYPITGVILSKINE